MGKTRQVRIVNTTGNPIDTRVIDAESGEPIAGVLGVSFAQDAGGDYRAEIRIEAELDVTAHASVLRQE
jgi:hypothetical protein